MQSIFVNMNKHGILVSLLLVLLLGSCTTDFDLNAPWKDITIVYGLLNQNDTIHYIKINKTFLGDSDAYDMAKIRDSSEYKNLSAVVEEWEDDVMIKSNELHEILITNKSTLDYYGNTGIFYAPEQKVYYFNDPNLNPKNKFKLVINIGEGKKTVSAETEIVDDFVVTFPPRNFPVSFATSTDYTTQDIKWASAKDGKRYDTKLVFHYNDQKVSGSDTVMEAHTIEMGLQTLKSFDIVGGKEMKIAVDGEDFYKIVGDRVNDITEDTGVLKRWPGMLDIVVTVAGDDLNTYIDVNSPSTGIVQEKPEFTNIDNGIGIFSSRYQKVEEREMSSQSITELVRGQLSGYTTAKGFCHTGKPKNDPESCYHN